MKYVMGKRPRLALKNEKEKEKNVLELV